jgi:hypothetical protein
MRDKEKEKDLKAHYKKAGVKMKEITDIETLSDFQEYVMVETLLDTRHDEAMRDADKGNIDKWMAIDHEISDKVSEELKKLGITSLPMSHGGRIKL